MDLIYQKAGIADLDILTDLRAEVLRAANGLPSSTDMSEIKRQTRRYYQRALLDDSHAAYLVWD